MRQKQTARKESNLDSLNIQSIIKLAFPLSYCLSIILFTFLHVFILVRKKNSSLLCIVRNDSNQRCCNKMIILIALFLIIGSPHIIIEVTPNTSIVATTNQLNIKILTNTSISNNSLTISFNTGFTLSSPCTVNSTTVGCSFTTSTTAVTATINSSFITNNYYLITLNITNPIYSSNFPITAAVSGSSFLNTGLVTINPKTISCSLIPSSQYVGDTPIGYFQISNDVLPANSIITINSTSQTSFPNLFNLGPICTIANSSYSCSLSSSFSQQFLTLNSPPQGSNLNVSVSTINNPPYNSSFLNIGIQIQNSAGNFMQVCSFQQQAVTTLRSSTNLALNNWNNQIGSTSTVSITLRTYFKPYSTSIIWVYPSYLSVTVLSPASSVLTTQNGSTSNFITSTTAVGNSLTFSAQITNPTSVQSLSSQIYVVFSSTQFIEQLQFSNMSLASLIFSPLILLSQYKTQYNSIYNASISLPYTVPSGFSGSLLLSYGTLLCSNFSLTSSTPIQVSSCTSNNLTFYSNLNLPQGIFWIIFNAQNYYSTINNSITITLAGPSPYYYTIGSGRSSFNLIINSHPFTINNINPVFYKQTQIIITQELSSINISPTTQRIVIFYLPKDLIFYANTSLVALNNSIILQSISSSTSTISLYSVGPISVQINNIANPQKYNGSLTWTISTFDSLNYPSSGSTSSQQPMYTSTTSYLTYQLSNSIIQANNTVTLSLIPALQYYSPPTITISFSNSLVLSCGNCSIVSSNSFTITYYSTIMKIVISIKNSNHPINNTITVVIASTFITYQTTSVSYNLQPMAYGYTATQSGLYGTIGYLNISITSRPTQSLTLTYSNVSSVLSNPTCVSCTDTLVYLSGIVQYFQTYAITLMGTSNGIVYASAVVAIRYVCQSIQGCNICVNETVNQTAVLKCQQCFDSSFTIYNLLYNNQCLQSCPIQTYSNGFTCVNCPNLCYICSSDKCNQCFTGYYIYNNTCISSCPQPLANNGTHCISVPISCPTSCANCPLNNVCTACNGGYYLLYNVCYSTCPVGYKPSGSLCVAFHPPQETSYFPFPFIISSAIIFITLLAMKCFEKRSLVMGNLIAFVSLVQVGSMLLTLTYALQSSQDLVTQSLCFILLFSKILINLIFLCYFIKAIGSQEQFEAWKQLDESHQKLYTILIILSSIFSFQIIRIIYSRLMGLKLFFGKFNTALIFKPLNYFTITYFFTAGAALVALSALTILLQEGYHTSAFYSSVQSIIIQAVLLITCIVDNKKGYDDEFFQYQIYKVNNQYQSSHIDVVDIQHQDGNASSMHQMINAVSSAPKSRKKGSQIVRNPRWVKKIAKPLSYPDEQAKPEEIQQIEQTEQKAQNGELVNKQQQVKEQKIEQAEQVKIPLDEQLKHQESNNNNVIQNKKGSLFRRKIIEDWRQIQSSLPKKMNQLRNSNHNAHKKKGKNKKSVSPQSRRKKREEQKALKRVSSMQQIQVKLPQSSQSISERIKQYFNKQQPINLKYSNKFSEQQSIMQKFKAKNAQNNKEYVPLQQPKSMTLQIDENSEDKSLQGLLNSNHNQQEYNAYSQEFDDYTNVDTRRKLRLNDHIEQQFPQRYNQSAYQQEKQSNTEEQSSNNPHINYENHSSKQEEMEEIQQNDIELQAESNKKINLGNYRYKGDEQKQKHYKTKKKRVNRQTEEVYLQRLVASSQRKTRNGKARKLQF